MSESRFSPPKTALRNLASLRLRERLIRSAWGASVWLSVFLGWFAVCCAIDYWADLDADTPFFLRMLFSLSELVIFLGGLTWLVRHAWQAKLPDDDLAQWVERKIPQFGHRLVTAVQLTRPNARTAGMSAELIAEIAEQADIEAGKHRFSDLADHTRLGTCKWVLGPLVGVVGLLMLLQLLYWPAGTLTALVSRQFLADVEIPRFVQIEPIASQQLLPTGDDVPLNFRANGWLTSVTTGWVWIYPDGQPSERYPLTAGSDNTFSVKVPGMNTNFTYRARLGDGRTRQPAAVRFEPRPVIAELRAYIILPVWLGTRPDGQRYEQLVSQGEVAGFLGSAARIEITASKPIGKATLVLLGRTSDTDPTERELQRQEMKLDANQPEMAMGTFDLSPAIIAYKVELEDRNGFTSLVPLRRGVAIAPDELPTVTLLPERFPGLGEKADEDTEVEGMPVPLGSRIRVAYYCRSPHGLDRANFVYRVNDGMWKRLPMRPVRATAEVGAFDIRRGVFDRTGLNDSVEFHAVPNSPPYNEPPGLEGGGRFDFQTKAIPELQVGDAVEYYIEVFDRNPTPGREAGRSEPRLKNVVTELQFLQWVEQTLEQEQKLRDLESKQRGIFDRTNP